jgi:hypothetical protein
MDMYIDIPLGELYKVLLKLREDGREVISQPLGFYRIFLTAQNALSPGLMLHAWLANTQPKQSNSLDIHSHTFDMTSRVLIGELVNELYEAIPDSNGLHKLVNVYHDGVSSRRIVSDLPVQARLISRETVHERSKYGFKSKIFHCTIINKYPTITLMEKSNMITENAINMMGADYQKKEVGEYTKPVFDQDAVWDSILNYIKKAI